VKELYYYLDGLPTHSYMRMLYKYPQATFPYRWLVEENRRRGLHEAEFELIDTGVFDNGQYFDVMVEYAKADTDDILMRITVTNRCSEPARLHVLPQLWARNKWSWDTATERPRLKRLPDGSVAAQHPEMPAMQLCIEQAHDLLFCENDTNVRRLYGMDVPGFFKDGVNDFVVTADRSAVNPNGEGSKCAAHIELNIDSGAAAIVSLRLRPARAERPAF